MVRTWPDPETPSLASFCYSVTPVRRPPSSADRPLSLRKSQTQPKHPRQTNPGLHLVIHLCIQSWAVPYLSDCRTAIPDYLSVHAATTRPSSLVSSSYNVP